jgi:hypothetical protein
LIFPRRDRPACQGCHGCSAHTTTPDTHTVGSALLPIVTLNIRSPKPALASSQKSSIHA